MTSLHVVSNAICIVEFSVEVPIANINAFEHDPFGVMLEARDEAIMSLSSKGMHQHIATVTRMRDDEYVDSFLLWRNRFAEPNDIITVEDWKLKGEI